MTVATEQPPTKPTAGHPMLDRFLRELPSHMGVDFTVAWESRRSTYVNITGPAESIEYALRAAFGAKS